MTDTEEIQHFESWSQVPTGVYLTRTQMRELDLPRVPGPVRATVTGYDWRDHKTQFDLHLISESTPSPASAAKLAAGRSGRPSLHLCTDCGAHPDLAVTVYRDGDRLCRACAHIRHLRNLQAGAAPRAAHTAGRAQQLLSSPLAIVHTELVDRGTTPSGARRPPAAVRTTVIDQDGRPLTEACVRLVGPRSKGVPDDAQDPDDVGQQFRDAFDGRTVVTWPGTGWGDLTAGLRAAGWTTAVPSGYGTTADLKEMTWLWRADLDPTTGAHRAAVPPGRADLMLYLLLQMAAEAPETSEHTPGGEPR